MREWGLSGKWTKTTSRHLRSLATDQETYHFIHAIAPLDTHEGRVLKQEKGRGIFLSAIFFNFEVRGTLPQNRNKPSLDL